MKRTTIIILILCFSGVSYPSDLLPVFNKMLEAKGNVRNYVLEYKVTTKERRVLIDEDGNFTSLDSYLEYEYSPKCAYDRGKIMIDAIFPMIEDEKVIEGETVHRQFAYDGSRQISREMGGQVYSISTSDEILNNVLSPFNLFDSSIRYLPVTTEEIRQGKTTVKERIEVDVHIVELSHDNGYKTTWVINTKKGHALESILLRYPSGSVCHERKVTEWKEFAPGVWLPAKAIYTGFRENGDLNRRHEYEVLETKVNAPEVDPALFTLKIPAGAIVNHVDLDIQQKLEGEFSDLKTIEEQLFENIEKKIASAEAGRSPVPKDDVPSTNTSPLVQPRQIPSVPLSQPRSPNKLPWVLGIVIPLIAAGFVILIVRRKP